MCWALSPFCPSLLFQYLCHRWCDPRSHAGTQSWRWRWDMHSLMWSLLNNILLSDLMLWYSYINISVLGFSLVSTHTSHFIPLLLRATGFCSVCCRGAFVCVCVHLRVYLCVCFLSWSTNTYLQWANLCEEYGGWMSVEFSKVFFVCQCFVQPDFLAPCWPSALLSFSSLVPGW